MTLLEPSRFMTSPTIRTNFALTVLLISMAISCPSVVLAQITYNIEQYTLSNGYEITGGFITTNGTIGSLIDTDITAYEIVVSGDVPYIFSSVNLPPLSHSISGNVIATPLEIIVPIDTDPSGNNDEFKIGVNPMPPDCDPSCFAAVRYNNTLQDINAIDRTRIQYVWDFDPARPSVFEDLIITPQQTIVVARVPEPTGVMLSLLGLCVVGLAARNRTSAS